MQLINERYPHFIHHLLDVVNAHTSIARCAVHATLLHHIHDEHASASDADALTYFLLFYSTPGPTLVQTLSTFTTYYQTDGLDQGCGIAGYAFNLTFSIAIRDALLSIRLPPSHPPLPPPVLIHDDTTITLPPSLSAATDPLYPIAAAAISDLLRSRLRLSIAPKKGAHFQPPLPNDSPLHIRHSAAHFHPEATVTSSHYRLAGGPVGTPEGRRAFLADLTATYRARLLHFTSIPAVHAHGAVLIITLCLRPQTNFNHHLRLTPPSITATPHPSTPNEPTFTDAAHTAAATAIATILRINPTKLLSDGHLLTAFQLRLPTTTGGISLPDPTTLAFAAFAASLIDSLPALSLNPLLRPLVSDPTTFAASQLPTLAAFHAVFSAITSTPTLAVPPPYDSDLHDTVHSLLFDPSTNLPSIANIRLLAHRHTQSVFSHALSRHLLSTRLATCSNPLAAARLRACALRGASSLLTAHSIPQGALLTNAEFTFFICHRLGIPPPSITPAASLRCRPKCTTVTVAKPIAPNHCLYPTHRHCYHQITCGASPLRHRRHDDLARLVAHHLGSEAGLDASTSTNLHSSLTSGTKVDLVLSSFASEHSTAIDFTISCPLLPSYAAAAALDAHAIITARAAEKTAKHASGSAARGRLFLPWVITTFGGIGPATIWHFIDSIYATSSSLAILNLTSAHAVATRKAHFLASFHASLIRSSYAMLTLHTAEPTTARPAHNPAHNPAQQRNDIPSPAPSIPTSDDDDDTPRRTTTTTPGRT